MEDYLVQSGCRMWFGISATDAVLVGPRRTRGFRVTPPHGPRFPGPGYGSGYPGVKPMQNASVAAWRDSGKMGRVRPRRPQPADRRNSRGTGLPASADLPRVLARELQSVSAMKGQPGEDCSRKWQRRYRKNHVKNEGSRHLYFLGNQKPARRTRGRPAASQAAIPPSKL